MANFFEYFVKDTPCYPRRWKCEVRRVDGGAVTRSNATYLYHEQQSDAQKMVARENERERARED
jgi:hypothetical protein